MKPGTKKFLIIVPALLALAACGDKSGQPAQTKTDTPAASQAVPEQVKAAANLKAGEAFLAENKDKPGVMTTKSGLQYKVIESGPADGVSPKADQFVCVNYAGRLIDGTEFDSSYKRGLPAAFPSDKLIKGWVEALHMMKPGDKWELYIPAKLGYGATGTPGGPIGPNEALVFDVNLIKNMNLTMDQYMQTYGKNPMLDCSKDGEAMAMPKPDIKMPDAKPAETDAAKDGGH